MSGTTQKAGKLNTGRPWHIWAADGTGAKHFGQGSVRFGRTMRRAKALNKFYQGHIFIAQLHPDIHSSSDTLRPAEERHYA